MPAFQLLKVFLFPYLALTLVCRLMGRLGIVFFINMDTQVHAIYQVKVQFLSPMPLERGTNIWSELESNPDPLASQATALTTRPCLFGPLLKGRPTVSQEIL